MRLTGPSVEFWRKRPSRLFTKTISPWTILLGVLTLGSLFSTASWAGGLYLTEFGTPSMGVANAGSGAIANDSSIAWHNPAGMTRLSGTHAQGNSRTHFWKYQI